MNADPHAPAQPIVSTHVFRFRSLRDASRSLFVDRRRLAAVDGLRLATLVFVGGTRTEGFTIGIVEPRRHLAMCVWEDEAALDRFRERSPIARAWREQTDQYCEVRMTPFRSHGTYRGREPLAGLHAEAPGDGPVAQWTFANIPLRSLYYFWSNIRHATRELLSSPGLIAGTAGPEHLYTGAMTFTIWESFEGAQGFAYRRRPHKRIVKDARDRALLTDSMFLRLRPYAVEGHWPARSRFAGRFETFSRSLDRRPPVARVG
jgi:hypothetical protein